MSKLGCACFSNERRKEMELRQTLCALRLSADFVMVSNTSNLCHLASEDLLHRMVLYTLASIAHHKSEHRDKNLDSKEYLLKALRPEIEKMLSQFGEKVIYHLEAEETRQ